MSHRGTVHGWVCRAVPVLSGFHRVWASAAYIPTGCRACVVLLGVFRVLHLTRAAKRAEARPERDSSHLAVRVGRGQSPGRPGRSPAITARYGRQAASTPAHSDVVDAVQELADETKPEAENDASQAAHG